MTACRSEKTQRLGFDPDQRQNGSSGFEDYLQRDDMQYKQDRGENGQLFGCSGGVSSGGSTKVYLSLFLFFLFLHETDSAMSFRGKTRLLNVFEGRYYIIKL